MISSVSNQLVKDLVRLRDRRHRDRQRRFLVEGTRPVAMAAAAGVTIEKIIICPALGGESPFGGVRVVEMSEDPFRKISSRQNPDGVLAVASHLDTDLAGLRRPGFSLVLVVESVEKPGNLGAMLRTADAAGADAVLVADPTTDVHNPNVVWASQGALFTVPLAVAPGGDVIQWLETHRLAMVATTPRADRPIWEVDLRRPVAILVGTEATGLTEQFLHAAEPVSIPMSGAVDSLNASVTAALALYEAVRQRSQG